MENSDKVSSVTNSMDMELRAKFLVTEYYNSRPEHKDSVSKAIDISDVFVVWFCKTIQNFKMLLGTNEPNDKLYYEVTYNGDKDEFYLDVYNQIEHKVYRPNEMNQDDKLVHGVIWLSQNLAPLIKPKYLQKFTSFMKGFHQIMTNDTK